MQINFIWKSKYSVWLETGECALPVDMHQSILVTSKSGSVFTAKGLRRAVREKMTATDYRWTKTGSSVDVN